MKKNGFTLIEIIAVVTLIAAISLMMMPLIINQINKSSSKIADSTIKVIDGATTNFVDENETEYPKLQGKIYCIKVKTLLEYEYLKEPLENEKGKKIVDTETDTVRVEFISKYESVNTLVKNCTPN
jgi:prepilin-type N-terminal cleavage/methylation domain